MLCENCQKFFSRRWTKKLAAKVLSYDKGPFQSELVISCQFCSLIKQASLSAEPEVASGWMLPRARPAEYGILAGGKIIPEQQDPECHLYIYGHTEIPLEFDLSREADILSHGVYPQAISSANTEPENSLPRIQAWIDSCTEEHAFCTQLRLGDDIGWHPTRLVDVSLATLGPSIRLEDNAEILLGVKYTTLSYCWGQTTRPLKLMSQNYDDLKRGILISSLPKTLQHSVALTRALNIPYIWIDALCIIQDSLENQDWLQESSSMSEVYGHSYLNIAASSSTSADGGLFYERDPVSVNGISVTPHEAHGAAYFIKSSQHWLPNLQAEPLSRRAWALQERRLSSRNLHFTKAQIYWECSCLCASEIYPKGKPWDHGETSGGTREHQTIANIRLGGGGKVAERHEAWDLLVAEYSIGKLSVATDRLIAIAGLAKSFNIDQEDQYLAGHWRLSMPQNLMWVARESHNSLTDIYRAPTWSWASVPDGIGIWSLSLKRECQAQVIQAEVENNGDAFGLISGGFIRLRGRLCKASLTTKPDDNSMQPAYNYRLVFKIGGFNVRSYCRVNITNPDQDLKQTVFCMDMHTEGGMPFNFSKGKWAGTRDLARLDPEHQGLILCRSGQEKGQFKRIGSYITWGFGLSGIFDIIGLKHLSGTWKQHLAMEAAFSRRDIPSDCYEEVDDQNRYTIRII